MSDDDMIRRGDEIRQATRWARGFIETDTVGQAIAAIPAVTPATSPGVTAGAVEPVAWAYGDGKRCLVVGHVKGRDYSNLPNAMPLYATPPTALDDQRVRKLVEAANKARIVLAEFEPLPLPVLGELLAALRDMEGA